MVFFEDNNRAKLLAEELYNISEAVREFQHVKSYEELHRLVAIHLKKLLPFDSVSLCLFKEMQAKKLAAKPAGEGGKVQFFHIHDGNSNKMERPGNPAPKVTGSVLQKGAGRGDSRIWVTKPSFLSVPVKVEDRIEGTLYIALTRSEKYNEGQLPMLRLCANICATGLNNLYRHQRSEEREKTNERLNMFFNSTNNLILNLDPSGLIIWVNKAFERFTGYNSAEVCGRHYEPFLRGRKTEPEKLEKIRHALTVNAPCKTKITTYSKSGEEFKVVIDLSLVLDADGKVSGYVVILNDISAIEKEKNDLEQTLNEIKDYSSFPLENPSPCFRYSKDGLNLLFANPAAQKLIDEFRGDDAVATGWYNFLKLCQTNNKNFSTQIKIKSNHYSCSVAYISGEKYFNLYTVEITDLIMKQVELIRIKNELSVQKQFYEEILNNVPVDIAVFNKNHTYLFLNKAAVRDETLRKWLIGRDDYDYMVYKKLASSIADERRAKFKKLLETGFGEPWLEERTDNDGYKKFKVRRFHTYNNREIVIGYGVDVTELKLIQNELEHKNQTLNEQNKELQQFTNIASHDLQEPVTTILQCADLFLQQSGSTLSPLQKKYLSFIVQSSKRMQNLVTALLEYSRFGNDRKLEKTDCNVLIKSVLKELESSIQISRASISTSNLPEFPCYASEMKVLFYNLISNAIKFNDGTRPPQVLITASEDALGYRFAVHDNGIGIDEQHFEKIFILFKRLHNRNTFDGIGMGLALCKKIVSIHRGSIWVTSEQGKGSVFYFTINKNIKDDK